MANVRPIAFDVTPEGCFVCTSHRDDGKGYRRIKRNVLMHRFIYEECFGEIPEGLVVRHKCDNRACINPEHLATGTRGDNAADMRERGRANRPQGTQNVKAKLTDVQALEIYQRAAAGEDQRSLVSKFGISIAQVNKIANRKSWTHITGGL